MIHRKIIRFFYVATLASVLIWVGYSHSQEVLPGFPAVIDAQIQAAPVIADYMGSGEKLEIVFGSWGSALQDHIYMFNYQGNVEWDEPLSGVKASASMADMNGDGNFEVIVGDEEGNLHVYDDYGVEMSGFPLQLPNAYSVDRCAPSIVDHDGDGNLEIIVGTKAAATFDDLFMVSHDGQIIWAVNLHGYPVGAPTIADVDFDYIPEIFIGTYEIHTMGKLYCLSSLDGSVIWESTLDGGWVATSPPAIGDLDEDGDLEVVFGLRSNIPPPIILTSGGALVFDAATGPPHLYSISTYGYCLGSSLGQIQGSDELEILLTATPNQWGTSEGAYCYSSGGNLLWSAGPSIGLIGSNCTAVIVDYDSDSDMEILFNGFTVGSSNLFCLTSNGSLKNGYPIWLVFTPDYYLPTPSPALGDINEDGNLNLVAANTKVVLPDLRDGYLYAFDMENPINDEKIEWYRYAHDERNTGRYEQPISGLVQQNASLWGRVLVWGDVTVGSGATLRIEAGTRVEVKDGYRISVMSGGSLIIEGTESYPVVFTSDSDNPSAGDWYGISALAGSIDSLAYCVIEYAEFGVKANSPSVLVVEDCTIKDNLTAGIYMEFAPNGTKIKNSRIENSGLYGIYGLEGSFEASADTIVGNRYGVKYTGGGNINIEDCLITYPSSPIQSYYGIWVKKALATPVPTIKADSITGFDQGGIYFEGVTSGLANIGATSVYSSGKSGIYYKNSSASINGGASSRNLLKGNGYGLVLSSSSSPNVRRTKFEDNSLKGASVSVGCFPDFGTIPSPGNNSFIRAEPIGSYKHLHNYNITAINAVYNYWNPLNPALIVNANYFPPLASDPLPKLIPGWDRPELAKDFELAKAYPNPFNPSTIISFNLSSPEFVTVKVFNIMGQEVRTVFSGHGSAGENSIVWDGKNHRGESVSAGVYLIQLRTSERQRTIKATVLK